MYERRKRGRNHQHTAFGIAFSFVFERETIESLRACRVLLRTREETRKSPTYGFVYYPFCVVGKENVKSFHVLPTTCCPPRILAPTFNKTVSWCSYTLQHPWPAWTISDFRALPSPPPLLSSKECRWHRNSPISFLPKTFFSLLPSSKLLGKFAFSSSRAQKSKLGCHCVRPSTNHSCIINLDTKHKKRKRAVRARNKHLQHKKDVWGTKES